VAPLLEQLSIGADAASWRRAGFNVGERGCRAGTVRLALGEGEGLLGWRLGGAPVEIDGLPVAEAAPGEPDDAPHPNGVTQIDHVVVFTPDLERTTAAFDEVGVERRRVREAEIEGRPVRQGFFRLGEVILEVVEHGGVEPGPARLWGITFTVADLDACAEQLGESLGSIRDAVQPGRRIASVRPSGDLGIPVALITPDRRT
jgi:hypothetical protein